MKINKHIKYSKYLYQQDYQYFNQFFEDIISEGFSTTDAIFFVEKEIDERIKRYLPEKAVEKAIRATLTVYSHPEFVNWANNWFKTKNQWGGDIMNGEKASVYPMALKNKLFRNHELNNAEKAAFYTCCAATSYGNLADVRYALEFTKLAKELKGLDK